MDMITNATTAVLRSRSESSFMVPTGADAFWHLAVSPRLGNAAGVVTGTAYDVPNGIVSTGIATATVVPTNNRSMVARDRRATAKQAGPPRGVPR